MIDAAEWVAPYDDERLGLHKVAKYYYYPGWWEGSATLTLFVGLKAYDALPKEYQAALQVACAEAQPVDDGQVRCGQSTGAKAACCRWSATAAVSETGDGCFIQGSQRGLCGAFSEEPGIPKNL